jgi:DNA polymerase elongation subunit (family B)
MTLTGWLFDVYPSPEGLTVWFIDQNGDRLSCTRKFTPSFFLRLNDADCRRAETLGARCPVHVSFERTTQRDLYSGDCWDVLRVSVHDATRVREAVWYYERFFPHFAFFNSDILAQQLFLYGADLFPLAFGDYTIERDELTGWTLHDSREDFEYRLPPLTTMLLRNANDFVPPKYQRFLQLELTYDGRTYTLQQETPREMLDALNWHLYRCDPDLLLTEYGDAILLPKIVSLARRHNVPLLLNRDAGTGYKISRESSFFQYGKVVHKDGAFELRGRWHVDVDNSFTVVEADLEGLFELVRVTQLCPQHQARASIGTGLSSLQLSWAYRNNYLIPSKKREPEEFKSAATLLMADRGGLIFMPPVGYHEQVAELDFVSMYPSIMVEKNVSPETVNCQCCENDVVPELGYTLCEKREGIVPATLRHIVKRRAYLKNKRNELRKKNDPAFKAYDRRQNALKWMLVSCFGYLGYKNARFGRIEAHESVNAFSRDAILTAKELAEAHGYTLIHAIIDCLWLKKDGSTEADYLQLCRDIARQTGIDISLEGIYDWICFPSSKTQPVMATGTRYVGRYSDGETKLRGIEARRRDTPKFVKNMQLQMLEEMAKVQSVGEIERIVPALLEIVREHVAILRSGKANPMELVLRRHLTREANEYTSNTISATVSKMLEETGVHLAAGELVEYIIVDATGRKQPYKAKPLALYAFEDGYDIDQYTAFVLDAASTLLGPFGYSKDALREQFVPAAKRQVRREYNMNIFDGVQETSRRMRSARPSSIP